MHNLPILSIIVPVYNAERYLAECLLSLFAQDLPQDSYEVLAVDNGSTDGSARILKELRQQHDNLRVVTLGKNILPSGGRNTGLDAAAGKYLIFVDADDYLYPNVLQHLVEEMENGQLDFAHFSNDITTDGVLTKGETLPTTPVVPGEELYFYDLKTPGVSWSKIYRRQFIEEHHLRCDTSILYEDDEFAFRLYAYAKKTRHICFSPYVYRANPYSATRNRINLPAMQSDMNEIQVVGKDIRAFKKIKVSDRLTAHMGKYIHYMINECFRLYHLFPEEQKKEVRRLYQRSINLRLLPYMSTKKFVLLKLGIVK